MLAIVDANILYAAADVDEEHHRRCLDVLQRTDLDLILPAFAVAEATYLVAERLGPRAEAEFLRGLTGFDVQSPEPEDWPAMAELLERYVDFPLGGTDASVAVLAERLGTDLIVTLDRRHFSVIRKSNGGAFTLLPE